MNKPLTALLTPSVLLLSCLFSHALFAQNAPPPNITHEYRLDNGLKVIIREDHRAPIVATQLWYKIGSSYEQQITGISHALEHMMFKGTKKYPVGEFSRIISRNGGRENAFTGKDYTAYFQILEKSRLSTSFKLESDRMRNLILDADEFSKEIAVVREERRMRTEDNPQSLTYEQFQANAFINGPYHAPVIGWMDDLENMNVTQLKNWYQRWYAPDNATLVVVGDVQPQEVLKLAKKYYGTIPKSQASLKQTHAQSQHVRQETPQIGLRRLEVKAPAKLPYLVMGYKTPVIKTANNAWEPYALEVIAGILDGGNSARLSTELVREQQIATSAGAGYDLYDLHSNLFMLDGTPRQDHSIAELEKALRAQVERLKTIPVSNKELDRIKAQVIAAQVYQRDSAFYQGMLIGQLETVGLDWRLLDNYVDNIRAITAKQIQQVASKYFIDDHLTIAELSPLPLSTNKPTPSHGHAH